MRNTYDPVQELCSREQMGFHDWAPSPFSFKVRAVLEYKAYSHVRHGIVLAVVPRSFN